jgi:fumarylacetoacetase
MSPLTSLNETHDPALRSWIRSDGDTDFPIQNLPFGVFRRQGTAQSFRGGVAIADQIVDLAAAADALRGEAKSLARVAGSATLNAFFELRPSAWSTLRLALSRALRKGAAEADGLRACLVPQEEAEYAVPADIGDYTDFYTSVHHATSVGRLFRPDNPLLPNYKWVPIGYHGRSSSIGVSGQEFHRPRGQTMAPGAQAPVLGPSKRLDYELELGIYIGTGNPLGSPISIDQAEAHVFGIALLNDWSARDLQAWEYQPLGPFLSKNFASTISPWIVTLEALAPYRVAWERPQGDPPPLPYLDAPAIRESGAIDIQLEVLLETARMREAGKPAQRVSKTSYRHAYWTVAQLVAHHTVNGCNLQPGDLLGSGTLSGPTPTEAGSLLELSLGGKQPIAVADNETRTFLEDGDAVTMRGWCEAPGQARIGFGECRATVLPARQLP